MYSNIKRKFFVKITNENIIKDLKYTRKNFFFNFLKKGSFMGGGTKGRGLEFRVGSPFSKERKKSGEGDSNVYLTEFL